MIQISSGKNGKIVRIFLNQYGSSDDCETMDEEDQDRKLCKYLKILRLYQDQKLGKKIREVES